MPAKHKSILYQFIVDNSTDMVIVTDANYIDAPKGPKITYVNQALVDTMGYSREELYETTPRIFQGPDTNSKTLKKIRKALIEKKPIRSELLNYTKSGKTIWIDFTISPIFNDDGKLIAFAAIERNITKFKTLEKKLNKLATTDPLTGIYNRRYFMQRLSAMHHPSMMIIDVDKLKAINDTYGHLSGDEVIIKISQVIKSICKNKYEFCRYGGDEFLISCDGISQEEIQVTAEKIVSKIADIKAFGFPISVSVGIAKYHNHDTTIYPMFQRADKALYKAKKFDNKHRHRICFHGENHN